MKVLVLNSGSSSLKFQLFDMQNESVIAKWIIEKIWMEWSFIEYQVWDKKITLNDEIKNHEVWIDHVFKMLTASELKVLASLEELNAIWHRVVHWGEYFNSWALVNNFVIEKIVECANLAPLHNPANLMWIQACQKLMPNTPQVAVFDTAFHQSMKPESFLYALPYEYYIKHKVRKYWFHGTSHKYIYERLLEIENLRETNNKDSNVDPLKVITCHIGNWASLTAITNGDVIDTSMWMTPLEWLLMGTRSGDIDPAIVTYIMRKEDLTMNKVEDVLNKKSWLLWLSEVTSDMRDIIEGYKAWHDRYITIMNMYINRIVKYIWAYIAMMGWVDRIVFTAWVLERSSFIRKLVIEKLARLGVKLDEEANNSFCKEVVVSTPDSTIKVIVIPTNEELMIAKETYELVK